MKALHVQTFCCKGIHGGSGYTDGIFVPERNLLIQYKNVAYVAKGTLNDFTTFKLDGGTHKPKVIKSIELGESVVDAATTLVSVRKNFTREVEQVWDKLIEKK